MSDSVQMLVDADVSIEQAKDTSRAVVAEFRRRGLITGRASGAGVLSGKGYYPGPSVPGLYALQKGEYRFWELVTCGLQANVGRGFNEWALGPACEGFSCPSCGAEIPPFDDDFDDAISAAVQQWLDDSGPARVPCPHCSKKTAVTKWICEPPLGFGNLSFRFWNWPAFDEPAWKLKIADLVRDITGHTIVVTHGHV
jgi:hypothetical protein